MKIDWCHTFVYEGPAKGPNTVTVVLGEAQTQLQVELSTAM